MFIALFGKKPILGRWFVLVLGKISILMVWRGKREEGRGKREEGRGKREEGRGKREEGRGKREEGRGKREEGRGREEGRMESRKHTGRLFSQYDLTTNNTSHF